MAELSIDEIKALLSQLQESRREIKALEAQPHRNAPTAAQLHAQAQEALEAFDTSGEPDPTKVLDDLHRRRAHDARIEALSRRVQQLKEQLLGPVPATKA